MKFEGRNRFTLALASCATVVSFLACGGSESSAPREQGSSSAASAAPMVPAPGGPVSAEVPESSASAAGASEETVLAPASENAGDASVQGGEVSAGARRRGIHKLDTGHDLTNVGVPTPVESAEAGPRGELEPVILDALATPHFTVVEGDPLAKLGTLNEGDKSGHVFKCKSDGTADLVITRLKPSCGCTVAQCILIGADGSRATYAMNTPIPPGCEFWIEVDLKTEGRAGPMQTQVAVFTNDANGTYNLGLLAEVVPALVVEPSPQLNLGQITSTETKVSTITVRATNGEPFGLTLDPQFIIEPLKAELVPLDPDAQGKSATWQLEVVLGPNIPEGMRNYPLVMASDRLIPDPKSAVGHDGKPSTFSAKVYVQAQVLGIVAAAPPFVSFGLLRPGEVQERTIEISSHDASFTLPPDLPITLESTQPGQAFPFMDKVTWTYETLQGGSKARLVVRMEGLPDDFTGSFGGNLRLAIGHPAKPELLVRFSGVCRAGIPDPTAGAAVPQPVRRASQPPHPAKDGGGGR